MGRERSPTVDGERRSLPRWDNPTGQLPGAAFRVGLTVALFILQVQLSLSNFCSSSSLFAF